MNRSVGQCEQSCADGGMGVWKYFKQQKCYRYSCYSI